VSVILLGVSLPSVNLLNVLAPPQVSRSFFNFLYFTFGYGFMANVHQEMNARVLTIAKKQTPLMSIFLHLGEY